MRREGRNLKYLLQALRTYRREAVLSPLFKLFEVALELSVPLVVAAVIDVGIANGDREYVLHACLLLVAFGVAGLGFALTAQYFAAKAAVGTAASLRSKLFGKIQSFSFSQIDGIGTAKMITLMTSDVAQVQTGVNMALRLFLRSPFVVFGAMGLAFLVDVRAALVFVAVIPLLAVAVYTVMGVCIPLYQKMQGRLDRVYLSTRENLSGVRVIRAFSLEEKELEEFRTRSGALKKAQKGVGRISALTGPVTFVLVNLALIALLYVGAIRVDGGALEQGQIVALYGYLAQILVELIKLANLIVTVTKAVSCQKRIGKVLDMEGEPAVLSEEDGAEETPDPSEAVRFENVSFSYGGGANALTGIDFSVKKGETVGILGGTGAGKSTLVNLIPRFYRAAEGRVLVGGENVEKIPAGILREKIGYVPQKVVLFKGSIRSNLLWGNQNADDRALLRAAELAQASDVLRAKGGLDGEIAQEGKNLSGGQRQRLTIARALVKEPEILILDDCSSALDYATERNLFAALKTLSCTVFLVSQRVSSMRHADRIVVLDDGKAVGIGTHEELSKTCGVYREILSSQERREP